MILTIDVGNSNLVFGLFNGNHLLRDFRIETEAFFEKELVEFLGDNHLEDVIISSVVPSVNEKLIRFCEQYFNIIPTFINSQMTALVDLSIDQNHEMGADLVCGLVGASIKYPLPLILVDCGTATKFMYLDQDKKFHGGSVALGIEKSLHALIGNAELLPDLKLAMPDALISINTITAIQSGIVLGHIKMIEGMVESIKHQFGQGSVILTGGLGNVLNGYINNVDVFDEHLLLYGLNAMYHEIREKK